MKTKNKPILWRTNHHSEILKSPPIELCSKVCRGKARQALLGNKFRSWGATAEKALPSGNGQHWCSKQPAAQETQITHPFSSVLTDGKSPGSLSLLSHTSWPTGEALTIKSQASPVRAGSRPVCATTAVIKISICICGHFNSRTCDCLSQLGGMGGNGLAISSFTKFGRWGKWNRALKEKRLGFVELNEKQLHSDIATHHPSLQFFAFNFVSPLQMTGGICTLHGGAKELFSASSGQGGERGII